MDAAIGQTTAGSARPQVDPPWFRSADRLPRSWWLWPLGVFALMRLLNVALMIVASQHQIPIADFLAIGARYHVAAQAPASPGFLTLATNWDGQWYWDIATQGYPTQLPRDARGQVTLNAWAFFPVYPMVVRAVMTVTGLGFPVAAVVTSMTAGAGAMVLLCRLVARRHGLAGGTIAVLLISAFITGPVFLMAYAEGLALLLLVSTLYAVVVRRYALALPLILLLSLTRGVAAPLAGALVLYALVLWRKDWGRKRDRVWLAVLGVWAGVASFAWFIVAGVVTGVPDAYRETQRAWNPELDVIPVVRFLERNEAVPGGRWTAVAVAILWAVFLVWLLTLQQDEPLLAIWAAVYTLFLLGVTDWNWSNVRYFLLALPAFWPLVHASREQRRTMPFIAMVTLCTVGGLALQWWYVRYCVVVSPQVVQVP